MAENTLGMGILFNRNNITAVQAPYVAKIKRASENIAESIHRILNTLPGERPGLPDFGCEIRRLLFEQNDFVMERMADYFIRKAIANFEPRVDILGIAVERDGNNATVTIWFNVKGVTSSSFRVQSTVEAG